MKAIFLVALVLSSAVQAQSKDAPRLDFDPVPLDGSAVLTPNPVKPLDTCTLTGEQCIAVAQRIRGLEAERDSLKQSIKESPSPVLMIAAGVLLGLGAGYLLATKVKP